MRNTCDTIMIYRFINGIDDNIYVDIYNTELIKYGFCWDYLMKAVEKIETLNYRVTITFSNCFIDTYNENDGDDFEQIALSNSDTKFNSVYDCVIQFINYYKNINKYV